ncbi:MAG: SCO family protein [Pseudomonadota bacterium]
MRIARHSIFVLGLLIAACSGGADNAAIPSEGVVRLSEQFTGDFDLIDQTGVRRTDEDFEGNVMLVYFGFTYCPDVCPGDVGVMSAALNALGKDADQVSPIFISVDPERDTPEALSAYFSFDDRIIALTGSIEAAKAARESFKMFAQKEPLPDSALEYTINHGRFFYITDRQGQPQLAMTGNVAGPEELAALVRRSIRKG